jgi:ABC-2 type transport system permease protein
MILHIARKEILEMRKDGRFLAASAIILTLLVLSVAIGWQQYREIHRQHEQARAQTRAQWLTQGKKNPHSAAHYGVYAFKPKSPLSLIDRGADNYTGVAVWLEAHKQNEFKYKPARDSNTLARFGELTASSVLQLLLPLLIILMSFTAFAGEREQGTLRLLLSMGVPRSHLALGKALGIAGGLGLLLIPAAILGSGALLLASDAGAFTANLPRLGWMSVSYLLYFAAFIGLSLTVSALAKSARLALVCLLAFWIFNGLAAPRLMSDLSRQVHRTPSSLEFSREMEQALREGNDPKELERRVLAEYKVKTIEELPVNFQGIALHEGEEHGNRVYDAMYGKLWDCFEAQNRFQQQGAMVAPFLAIRSISMGLSGTDFAHFRDFSVAAERYRRYFIEVLNEDVKLNPRSKERGYLASDDLWGKVKPFTYEAPAVADVLAGQATSLAVLAAWALATALAAGYVATRRLEAE